MEQVKYQFDLTSYSQQDLLALNKLSVKKNKLYRWLTLVFRLILCLAGIFFLLAGALLIYGGSIGAKTDWPLSAIMILLGLLWLCMGIFYYQRKARRSRRISDAGRIRAAFSDDGIEEESNKSRTCYRYDAFVGAYDYRGRWFLFLDKRHAIILPRAAMTMGKMETFASFLEQKLGKQIIYITS